MEYVVRFFLTSLVAIAVENPLFARALGTSRTSIFIKSPKWGILFGAILTGITVLASIPAYGIRLLVEGRPYTSYVRAPSYVLIICVIYIAIFFLFKKISPKNFVKIEPVLSLAAFNCAGLGALLISHTNGYDLIQSIGNGFGSGVGFLLALLVIYIARRRIKLSDVPVAFRGLPVMLVYLGILALAIYGLLGHQLPT